MLIAPGSKPARPRLKDAERQAPLGGLDLMAPISAPRPLRALKIDDFVCRTDGLHTRAGIVVQNSLADPVRAFLPYQGQLFAATDGAITFNGTTALSGFLGGDWMSAVIANAGGQHMVAVNGTDALRRYDGLSWSAPTVEGVDTTDLFTVVNHQRRLFFAEAGTLRLWYLALNAFAGPAWPIPMTAQFREGGSIAAIASMTSDGGFGPDDVLCVITTEGELALWTGNNPSRADSWRLIGVFRVGKPKGGKRAFCTLGGILAVMTERGTLPIPAILQERESGQPLKSLSYEVDIARSAPTQMLDSASAKLALIQDGSQQWVMSDTGAWSRFTLPGVTTWCEHAGKLYFGTTAGKVCRYEGADDAGEPIAHRAVCSFDRYGTAARKIWKRCRLIMSAPLRYQPLVSMLCDYQEVPATAAEAAVASEHWYWPDVSWFSQPMPWRRETSHRLEPWQSLGRNAVAGALAVAMRSTAPVVWTGFDVAYTEGGARGR